VLQTGAGVALPLIVRDPPGYLSPQIASMNDRVLVIQDLSKKILQMAAKRSGDELRA